MSEPIRIWCIGDDGTEYYAAHSEEEMRSYMIETLGREEAERSMEERFEEVPDSEMDAPFQFNDDGEMRTTTWRQLAAEGIVPRQVSTGYN